MQKFCLLLLDQRSDESSIWRDRETCLCCGTVHLRFGVAGSPGHCGSVWKRVSRHLLSREASQDFKTWYEHLGWGVKNVHNWQKNISEMCFGSAWKNSWFLAALNTFYVPCKQALFLKATTPAPEVQSLTESTEIRQHCNNLTFDKT